MPLVKGIRFEAREGSEPVTMILEVYNPEIDIELDERQVETETVAKPVPMRWDEKTGQLVPR